MPRYLLAKNPPTTLKRPQNGTMNAWLAYPIQVPNVSRLETRMPHSVSLPSSTFSTTCVDSPPTAQCEAEVVMRPPHCPLSLRRARSLPFT